MKSIALILSLTFFLILGIRHAQAQPKQQSAAKFKTTLSHAINYPYWLYLPHDYQANKKQKYPLILFLHGSGERGTDLEAVKRNGLPKNLENDKNFPFIVVSPQLPNDQYWSDDWAVEGLNALLNKIERQYRVDPDRIYLTGLSMGGYGTWALATQYPQRFAAIAPVCGGGKPDKVCNIRRIPTWAFHGAKDTVVPLTEGQTLVDALKNCEGNVTMTIYPEAGHDAWTETYNNPKLYEWFLSHKRTPKKTLAIKPSQVSSTTGRARMAFDGNFDTRWESTQSDPQELIIDLEKEQTLQRATLYWEAAYGRAYELLSSTDREHWHSIHQETQGNGGVDKIELNQLKIRYLKFNFTQRGTQWGYSLWEIELE